MDISIKDTLMIYVISLLCILPSQVVSTLSVCYPRDGSTEMRTCFFLYDTNSGVTWSEARDRCKASNQTLAMVRDDNAKATISQLLKTTKPTSGGHIWLSGKRAADRMWRYMHQKSETENLNGQYPSERYCGMYQYGREHAMSDTCVRNFDHYGLCQYTATQGVCLQGDIEHGNHCYHVTDKPVTWFEARTYCISYTNGSDLSVDIIPSSKLTRTQNPMYLWLALARMNWQWVDQHDATVAMTTYNFIQYEGSESLRSSCLYMADTEGWYDKSCDDSVRYYICQQESAAHEVPNPTESVPDMAEGDSEKSARDNTDPDDVTTQNTPNQRPVPATMSPTTKYIIIGSCVGFTLIAVIVTITVILLKRRNSSKSTKPNKFASLYTRRITKSDIHIIQDLPDDIPDLNPGYSSIPNVHYNDVRNPVRTLDHRTLKLSNTMDDAYSEISAAALPVAYIGNETGRESTYQNLPDLPMSIAPYQEDEQPISPTESLDGLHVMADSGDVYTLVDKQRDDGNDVVVDNPSYVPKN